MMRTKNLGAAHKYLLVISYWLFVAQAVENVFFYRKT